MAPGRRYDAAVAMRSRGAVVLRLVLVLVGLGLIAGSLVYLRVPRPSSARVEAALGVVGVDTGGSYAWIVKTATGAVLVDAGLDPQGRALLEELQAQGVPPEKVHAVLVTHAHPDHWAAAHLFPNAKVYVGPGDLPFLKGDAEFEAFGGGLVTRFMERGPTPVNLEALPADLQLELDGAQVRALHTPGHTPGSMAFLYGDLLFIGDSAVRDGEKVAFAPSTLSEAPDQVPASLRKLLALPFTRMADGHAGVTADARQKLGALLD